jgi:hypothetical protein
VGAELCGLGGRGRVEAAAAGIGTLLAGAELAARIGGCGRDPATAAYRVERTRAAYWEAWTELAAAAAPRKAKGDVLGRPVLQPYSRVVGRGDEPGPRSEVVGWAGGAVRRAS